VITWDETKRQQNVAKHGIDLAYCVIFDVPMLTVEDKSESYGEKRMQSLGLFYGIVVFMVWVDRPAAAHIISVRKGVKHEERKYWQAIQD
jgi:uncharacterized DUF497 family protein